MSGAIPPLPQYTFMAWCSVKAQEKLYLYLYLYWQYLMERSTWGYPKVPGLAACSENCKWYSSLPIEAVVSLFCE
jgi:hypothetical protein